MDEIFNIKSFREAEERRRKLPKAKVPDFMREKVNEIRRKNNGEKSNAINGVAFVYWSEVRLKVPMVITPYWRVYQKLTELRKEGQNA